MLYLTLLHNVSPILMLLTVQTNKISPEFLLPYMLLFFALRKIYHNINITKNTRVTCQHSALNPEICACPELRVSKAEETTTLDPRPSLSGQARRTISHAQKGIVLGLRMRKLRVATWNWYIALSRLSSQMLLHSSKVLSYFKIAFTTMEYRLSNKLYQPISYNTRPLSILFCWQGYNPFKRVFSSVVCFFFG